MDDICDTTEEPVVEEPADADEESTVEEPEEPISAEPIVEVSTEEVPESAAIEAEPVVEEPDDENPIVEEESAAEKSDNVDLGNEPIDDAPDEEPENEDEIAEEEANNEAIEEQSEIFQPVADENIEDPGAQGSANEEPVVEEPIDYDEPVEDPTNDSQQVTESQSDQLDSVREEQEQINNAQAVEDPMDESQQAIESQSDQPRFLSEEQEQINNTQVVEDPMDADDNANVEVKIEEATTEPPTLEIKNESQETKAKGPKIKDEPMQIDEVIPNMDINKVSQQKVKFLEERVITLENFFEKSKKAVLDYAQQNADLKAQLNKKTGESITRDSKISNLENQSYILSKDNEALKEQLRLQQKQNAEITAEKSRLLSKVNSFADHINTIKSNTKEYREKVMVLEAEVMSGKENALAMKVVHENIRTELVSLRNSKNFYADVEADLLKERFDAHLKITELEAELKNSVSALELSRQELESRTAEFNIATQKQDTKISDMENALNALNNSDAEKTAQISQLTTQNAELTRQLAEYSSLAASNVEEIELLRDQLENDTQVAQQRAIQFDQQCADLRAECDEQLKLKDNIISTMRADISQLTEQLKFHTQMQSSDSEVSPIAAKAAEMFRSADSVTGLYSAHFALIKELELKNVELREAHSTVSRLRAIFIANAPLIRQKNEQFEHDAQQITQLQAQMAMLRKDREIIIADKESCANELRFTKTTLEKYQRDCQTLSGQIQHLMGRATNAEPGSANFSTIQELQQKNLDLISQINTMEVEKEEAIRSAQGEEYRRLQDLVANTKKELETALSLKSLFEKEIGEVKEQRDYFKHLYEEQKHLHETGNEPIRVTELRRALDGLRERAENAEAQAAELRKELLASKNSSETIVGYNESIENSLRSQLVKMEERVAEKQERVNEMRLEKQDVENRYAELQRRLAANLEQCSRLAEAQQKGRTQIDDITAEWQKAVFALKGAEGQLRLKEAALRVAELDNSTLRQKLQAHSQIDVVAAKVNATVTKRSAENQVKSDTQIALLSAERDNLHSTIAALKTEKSAVETELNSEVIRQRAEADKLRHQLAAAEKIVEPQRMENSQLLKQCEELMAQLDALKGSAREFAESREGLLEKTAELEAIRVQLQSYQKMAEYWENKYDEILLGNNSQLNEAAECNEPTHAVMQNVIAEVRKQLNESEEANTDLQRNNALIRLRFEDAEAAETKIRKQLTENEEKLANVESALNQTRESLNVCTTERDRLREDVTALRSEVETSRTTVAVQSEELKSAHENLEEERNAKLDAQNHATEIAAKLSTAAEELRLQRENAEMKITQFENLLEKAHERERQLDDELTVLRTDLDAIATAESSESASAVESEMMEDMAEEVRQSRSVVLIAALRRALDSMKEERIRETSRRLELITELDIMRKSASDIEKRDESLRLAVEKAQLELKAKQTQLERQRQRMSQFDVIESTLAALETERDTLRKRCNDLDSANKSLAAQLEDEKLNSSKRLAALSEDLTARQNEINALEESLKERIEASNKSKTDIAELKRVNEQLRNLAQRYRRQAEMATAGASTTAEEPSAEPASKRLRPGIVPPPQAGPSSVVPAAPRGTAVRIPRPRGPLSVLRNQLEASKQKPAQDYDIPTGKANIQKELQQKAKQLLQVSAENQTLKSRIEQLEIQLAEATAKVTELEKNKMSLEFELAQMEERSKKSEEEAESVKMRNVLLQQQWSASKNRLEQENRKREELEKRLDQLSQTTAHPPTPQQNTVQSTPPSVPSLFSTNSTPPQFANRVQFGAGFGQMGGPSSSMMGASQQSIQTPQQILNNAIFGQRLPQQQQPPRSQFPHFRPPPM